MSPVAVSLKHISRFRDRHGHLRHYLRIPGRKAVPLPGEPGSPEFMAAYHAALAAPAAAKGRAAPAPGTLDAVAISYYDSPKFLGLRATTQRVYRRLVEQLRAKHGAKPIAMLDAQGVQRILAEKAGPVAANHRLRVLRAICQHAVATRVIPADPTAGVDRRPAPTEGFATWTEAEIAAFEARWPSGSRPRLAMALLLYTGQRRSDVVRMGRQHLVPGGLEVRQVKTGVRVVLPIHSALAAELAQVPGDRLTWLVTETGAAFSPGGFYNAFREWAAAAGVPAGRSPHGLRKACGRRLAEAGCSAHQIMAILGVTLKVAAIYTAAAEQVRLAQQGMATLENIRRP